MCLERPTTVERRLLPVAQNDDEEVTEDDDIESEDFGLGVAMVMSMC